MKGQRHWRDVEEAARWLAGNVVADGERIAFHSAIAGSSVPPLVPFEGDVIEPTGLLASKPPIAPTAEVLRLGVAEFVPGRIGVADQRVMLK